MKRMLSIRFLFAVVLWVSFPFYAMPQSQDVIAEQEDLQWKKSLTDSLNVLLQNELFTTSQLGLCVYDLTADSMLFAHQKRQRMRPASTQKLLTAIAALSELGADYSFATRLYISGKVNKGTLRGNVYVIGGFDPTFGRAEMRQLVDALLARGIKSVSGTLYADVSMKDTLKWGLGWCWDDKNPVLTPLLYGGKDVFLSKLTQVMKEKGIRWNKIGKEKCPSDAILIKTVSTPIRTVLDRMMKESDNLYAESVFYALAAKDGQPQASRKDALYVIERLIGNMGYEPAKYKVADGSGLSLYNYLTPELETALLRYAYKHQAVYVPLYESLPVAGVDGTLKNRMKETPAFANVRGKTGTLTGVYSLAGYATASNGHQLAFCIINQGVESASEARDFQDKVCILLCK